MPDEDDQEEVPPALDIPNAADPKRIRRQQDRAKREEEEAKAFWKAVLASPIGRREMWRVIESGHAFDRRFPAASENGWAFIGQQRFALNLYQMLQFYDFDGVAVMQRENDAALRPAS